MKGLAGGNELAWIDGQNNGATVFVRYDVYRSTSPTGPFMDIGDATSTSFFDSGAATGTSYYYLVRDVYSSPAGQTASSEMVFRFWPQDGWAGDIQRGKNANSVRASWPAYPLEWVKTFVGLGTTPGADDVAPFIDVGHATNYQFTGLSLTTGQKYHVTVKVQNAAGYLNTYGTSVSSSKGFTVDTSEITTDTASAAYFNNGLARSLAVVHETSVGSGNFSGHGTRTWSSRVPITVTEPDIESRHNAPCQFTIVRPVGEIGNGRWDDEARVADEFGNEIPVLVTSQTTAAGQNYATMSMIVTLPRNSSRTYWLYWNNNSAVIPSYGFVTSTADTSQREFSAFYSRKLLPPGIEPYALSAFTELPHGNVASAAGMMMTLPWTFPFFEIATTTMYFSSRGCVTVASYTVGGNTQALFRNGPHNGMIAPFWTTGLTNSANPANSGLFRYNAEAGTPRDRWICYSRGHHLNDLNDTYLHQAVLYRSGDIALRYEYLTPDAVSVNPGYAVNIASTAGISRGNNTSYFTTVPLTAGLNQTPTSFFQSNRALTVGFGAVESSGPRGFGGFFDSVVFDGKAVSEWASLTATITIVGNARLSLQTRTGNTPTPDPSWQPWAAVTGLQDASANATGTITSIPGRYLQYRCSFTKQNHADDAFLEEVIFSRKGIEVESVTASPSGDISQGQSGIAVRATIRNRSNGPVTVSNLSLKPSLGSYTISLVSPTLPHVLAANDVLTATFSVDVLGTSPLGTATIHCTASTSAPLPVLEDHDADSPHLWRVLSKARLSINAVDAPSVTVNKGQSGITARLRLENLGEAPLRFSGATLTFDLGAYTQTQTFPASGALIPGLSAFDASFTVNVLGTSVSGLAIINGMASAINALSFEPLSATAAVVPDSWTVQAPANLIFESIVASSIVYCGQRQAPLLFRVLNYGEAGLLWDDTLATFSLGTYDSVTPLATMPAIVPGGGGLTVRYGVDVSPNSATGLADIDATIEARDANSLFFLTDVGALFPSSWTVSAAKVNTYKDAGFLYGSNSFNRPAAANIPLYARAENLIPGKEYAVRWYNSAGTEVASSNPALTADASGTIMYSYTLTPASPMGTWLVKVTNPLNTELYCQNAFQVVAGAKLSVSFELPQSVTVGQTFVGTMTFHNTGEAQIVSAYPGRVGTNGANLATLVTGPNPGQLTIPPNSSATLNFSWTAANPGYFQASATGFGYDANSDEFQTAATATSLAYFPPSQNGLWVNYYHNLVGPFPAAPAAYPSTPLIPESPPTIAQLCRVDANVYAIYGDQSPDASVNPNQFGARWTGYIVPAFSATYTFLAASDDGARVWVDNTLVINSWRQQSMGATFPERRGAIALQAGRRYVFQVEFYENTGDAGFYLNWSCPSLATEVIPTEALFPRRTYCIIQTAPNPSIVAVNAAPTNVTLGSVNQLVEVGVRNTGSATAILEAASLTFSLGSYTQSLIAPALPYSLAGGTLATLTFNIDVWPESPTGLATVTASFFARDLNRPTTTFSVARGTDTWTINSAGALTALCSANSGFAPEQYTFTKGQTVFVRFINLVPNTNYRIAFGNNANSTNGGAAIATSPLLNSGPTGVCDYFCFLDPLATYTWTTPVDSPTCKTGKWRTIIYTGGTHTSIGAIQGIGAFFVEDPASLAVSLSLAPESVFEGDSVTATLVASHVVFGVPGLMGEYFDDPGPYNDPPTAGQVFQGPRQTRIDEKIQFNWGAFDPIPGVTGPPYSIRWRGYVLTDANGVHQFSFRSEDGMRLILNGQTFSARWVEVTGYPGTNVITNPNLFGKERYPIEVQYYFRQFHYGAIAEMLWQTPTVPSRYWIQSKNLITSIEWGATVDSLTPSPLIPTAGSSGTLEETAGPVPVVVSSLAPKETATFTWTFRAASATGLIGSYSLRAALPALVSGNDRNSGATVTSVALVSNSIKVYRRDVGLSTDVIDFGVLRPGDVSRPIVATLTNLGNYPLQAITWNAVDLAATSGARISLANVQYSPTPIGLIATATPDRAASFTLTIPYQQASGTYVATMSVYEDINANSTQDASEPYDLFSVKVHVSAGPRALVTEDHIDLGPWLPGQVTASQPFTAFSGGNMPLTNARFRQVSATGSLVITVLPGNPGAMPPTAICNGLVSAAIPGGAAAGNYVATWAFWDDLNGNATIDPGEASDTFQVRTGVGSKSFTLAPATLNAGIGTPTWVITCPNVTLTNTGQLTLDSLQPIFQPLSDGTNIIASENLAIGSFPIVAPAGSGIISLRMYIPAGAAANTYSGRQWIYEDANKNGRFDTGEASASFMLQVVVPVYRAIQVLATAIDVGGMLPGGSTSAWFFCRNIGNVTLSNLRWETANLLSGGNTIPAANASFPPSQPFSATAGASFTRLATVSAPPAQPTGDYTGGPFWLFEDWNPINTVRNPPTEPQSNFFLMCQVGSQGVQILLDPITTTGNPSLWSASATFSVRNSGSLNLSFPKATATALVGPVTIPASASAFAPIPLSYFLPGQTKTVQWAVIIPSNAPAGTYNGKITIWEDKDLSNGINPGEASAEANIQLTVNSAQVIKVVQKPLNMGWATENSSNSSAIEIINAGNLPLNNLRFWPGNIVFLANQITSGQITCSAIGPLPIGNSAIATITVIVPPGQADGAYSGAQVIYDDSAPTNASYSSNEASDTFTLNLSIGKKGLTITNPCFFGSRNPGATYGISPIVTNTTLIPLSRVRWALGNLSDGTTVIPVASMTWSATPFGIAGGGSLGVLASITISPFFPPGTYVGTNTIWEDNNNNGAIESNEASYTYQTSIVVNTFASIDLLSDLDFGKVPRNSGTLWQDVGFRNQGNVPLNNLSWVFNALTTDTFIIPVASLSANALPATVAPGAYATCQVRIDRIGPTQDLGKYRGVLQQLRDAGPPLCFDQCTFDCEVIPGGPQGIGSGTAWQEIATTSFPAPARRYILSAFVCPGTGTAEIGFMQTDEMGNSTGYFGIRSQGPGAYATTGLPVADSGEVQFITGQHPSYSTPMTWSRVFVAFDYSFDPGLASKTYIILKNASIIPGSAVWFDGVQLEGALFPDQNRPTAFGKGKKIVAPSRHFDMQGRWRMFEW